MAFLLGLWNYKEYVIIAALSALLFLASQRIETKTAEALKYKTLSDTRLGTINSLQAVAKAKDEAISASVNTERTLTNGTNDIVEELLRAPSVEDDVVAPIGRRAFDGMRRLEGTGKPLHSGLSAHTG